MDEQLRRDARRGTTGDAATDAATLAAARRAGRLDDDAIGLAAYAGHEGARALLAAEGRLCTCEMSGKTHGRECPLAGLTVTSTPRAVRIPGGLWKWLRHFPERPEVVARVALAVAEVLRSSDEPPTDSWQTALHTEGRDPARALTVLADHARRLPEAALRAALRDALAAWALEALPARPDLVPPLRDGVYRIATGAHLRAWRERRTLTRPMAARALGVMVAELTRTEVSDAPLGPALREALERYQAARAEALAADEARAHARRASRAVGGCGDPTCTTCQVRAEYVASRPPIGTAPKVADLPPVRDGRRRLQTGKDLAAWRERHRILRTWAAQLLCVPVRDLERLERTGAELPAEVLEPLRRAVEAQAREVAAAKVRPAKVKAKAPAAKARAAKATRRRAR